MASSLLGGNGKACLFTCCVAREEDGDPDGGGTVDDFEVAVLLWCGDDRERVPEL